MPVPTTKDWQDIAAEFHHRWNSPNCVGYIDGKHVVIQNPDNYGSLYYCYKGTFSIVLLAVVDAKYSFCIIEVVVMGGPVMPAHCCKEQRPDEALSRFYPSQQTQSF